MDDFTNTPSHLKKDLIIKSSFEIIQKWVKIHVSGYIEKLDEKLFNLADKSGSNSHQVRYFQTRDEVIRNKTHIQEQFIDHINQAFTNYLNNKQTVADTNTNPHSAPSPSLSLVNNNDLEETLAISSMSRKLNMQCAEYLHNLNQRLSVLHGGSKLTSHGNPVAPGVFAEAIREAISELTLDSMSKLVIYKVFEAEFMTQLNRLYDLLSKHFEHQGLLPHLKQPQKTNQPPSSNDEQPDELQALTSQTSINHQIQLFEAIRQLQSQQPPIPNLAGYSVPMAQIITSIAQLQYDSAKLLSSLENPQAILTTDISQIRKKSEQEALKIQNVDTHSVEIVGLLFEYMLNDQQLPDSVKALLSYLHTPFLKIALLDKDFFNHPEHPARQLLNSLVAAGERWVEPTGKHNKNDVYLQIKLIVQKLLNDADNSAKLFSELAFEFNHYLRLQTRRIRLSEKRAMQAAKGENKLKEIRLKVDGYLKKKSGNILLSPTIRTLLFEPWANFLSFNLLRFGSSSEQWRAAALTVDDLLWFSQPHNPDDVDIQRKLKQMLPQLRETIQNGFDTVGYDHAQGAHLLDVLNRQQSLYADTNPTPTKVQIPVVANIDEVDISIDTSVATKKDALLLQLKTLEFGTWFIFNAGTADAQRVKLAWSNTNTLHFMFVNRMGQQVAVKTGHQLAKEIRNNQVKILDKTEEKPFFEKAMERVLEQIKKRKYPNDPS